MNMLVVVVMVVVVVVMVVLMVVMVVSVGRKPVSQPVPLPFPGTPEHPERGANNDHCGNQLEPRFC